MIKYYLIHLTVYLAYYTRGADDDPWNDEYHGVLVNAVRIHLEKYDFLLSSLLARFQQSFSMEDWPLRRITLAAVAACIEVMPIAVQKADLLGNLEMLLAKATTDAESSTSRRFALTAFSYLRTVTPAVIPALLAGCQDTDMVQRDAIMAAGRFQVFEGHSSSLSPLISTLSSESVSAAYAATRLLGALGISLSGKTAPVLRRKIIKAFVEALQTPKSQRKVIIAGQDRGMLEEAIYAELLQVTGWSG